MAPELLRISNNPELIHLFPKELHDAHRPKERQKSFTEQRAERARAVATLWNDDDDDDDAAVLARLENARVRMATIDGTTGGGKKRHHQQSATFTALGKSKKAKAAVGGISGGGSGIGGGKDEAKDDAKDEDDLDFEDAMFGSIFGA